jgi:septal ring factor EnvC (AmiA/AmiB activator)
MGEEDFIYDPDSLPFLDYDDEPVSVGGHWYNGKVRDQPTPVAKSGPAEAGRKYFEDLAAAFGRIRSSGQDKTTLVSKLPNEDNMDSHIDLPFTDIQINKLTPKTEGHEELLEDALKKQQSQTDNLEKAVLNIKEAQESVRRDREEVEDLFTQASATMEEAEERWTSVNAKQQELKDLQAKLAAKAKDLEEREKALAVATANLIEREQNLEFKTRVLNPEKDKDGFSFVPGRLGRLGS